MLITGCSSGIGWETAREFQTHGWTVYATARDLDDITDLRTKGCETAELDVTDSVEIETVVDRIIDANGHIDCLVNNAGYCQTGAIEELPMDAVEAQFDVNLYGPIRLIKAVAPHMREQDAGTIINVTSVLGRFAVPVWGVYCASKFALEGLSDTLRMELKPFGVHVVCVEPPFVSAPAFYEQVEAGKATFDVEGSAYRPHYAAETEGREQFAKFTTVEPSRVARTIVTAASIRRPKARYAVGKQAWPYGLVRRLPEWMSDRLLAGDIQIDSPAIEDESIAGIATAQDEPVREQR